MLYAPLINKAYEDVDEHYMKVFTLGVFLIAIYLGFIWGNEIDRSGYNFFHFVVLYSIGRSMSKGWIHASKLTSMVVFSSTILINMILACIFIKWGRVN